MAFPEPGVITMAVSGADMVITDPVQFGMLSAGFPAAFALVVQATQTSSNTNPGPVPGTWPVRSAGSDIWVTR